MDIRDLENWLTITEIRKQYGARFAAYLIKEAEMDREIAPRLKYECEPTALKTRYGWIFAPSQIESLLQTIEELRGAEV